jgi:hypothetical protein
MGQLGKDFCHNETASITPSVLTHRARQRLRTCLNPAPRSNTLWPTAERVYFSHSLGVPVTKTHSGHILVTKRMDGCGLLGVWWTDLAW